MRGYVIFDASTGAHVVSHAVTKGLGLAGVGDGDGTQQLQAIAAMCFGLLANGAEATGSTEDEPSPAVTKPEGEPDVADGADSEILASEKSIRALERDGIELGDAAADSSLNGTALRELAVGDVTLHFFRHRAVPLACVVSVPRAQRDSGLAADQLAEDLCKAFLHRHGPEYFEAAAAGRAKPFRKAFAPEVEKVLLRDAGRLLQRAARVTTAADPALAPVGHFVSLVASSPGDGRWALQGEVCAGGVFKTTFAPLSLFEGDAVQHRAVAFDRYLYDVTHDHQSEAPDEVARAMLEVNGSASESFSVVDLSTELGCFALSTLRLIPLVDQVLNNGADTPTDLAQRLRATVHALAKVRSSFERAVDVVPLCGM
jgi:hypothetical protein